MSETDKQMEDAVQKALEAEQVPAVEPSPYPVEGIDLSPAFAALIEKMKPVRDELLKLVTSPTEHQFSRERELLVQYQGYRRAFHVLAGYVSPDGRVLEPMSDDPEQAKERLAYIEESGQRSGNNMKRRARQFSNVPLEPMRAERRFEPEEKPAPGWLGRRRAVA